MSNDKKTDGPIRLVEDEVTGERFLIYRDKNGLQLDIQFDDGTLWMTQAKIAELFGVGIPAISKHLSNIFAEGELDQESTLSKMEKVQNEGGRSVVRVIDHYNLDAIISVGYRVSSTQATLFRRWATSILIQYAEKGFVVDSRRLKNPANFDRIKELREIIRDIRADETNVYRELRQICAMCKDYDATSEASRAFYMKTQAKLIFAVTSNTPSEVTYSRADHRKENMGLETWPKEQIRKADVTISKNYLGKSEIEELNRLTNIVLDVFEDQLNLGRIVVMEDAEALLDRQLNSLNRVVLSDGGTISRQAATDKAHKEYALYDYNRKELRRKEADRVIAELIAKSRRLPKSPRRK